MESNKGTRYLLDFNFNNKNGKRENSFYVINNFLFSNLPSGQGNCKQ